MKVVLLCSLDGCDQPVDPDPIDEVKIIANLKKEARYCHIHGPGIVQRKKRFDESLRKIKAAHKRLGEIIGDAVWQDDLTESDINMMFDGQVLEASRKIITAELPL